MVLANFTRRIAFAHVHFTIRVLSFSHRNNRHISWGVRGVERTPTTLDVFHGIANANYAFCPTNILVPVVTVDVLSSTHSAARVICNGLQRMLTVQASARA